MTKIGKSTLSSKPRYHGKSTAGIERIRKTIIKKFIYQDILGGDLPRRPSTISAPSIASYKKPKGYEIRVNFFNISNYSSSSKQARKIMRFLYDSGITFKTKGNKTELPSLTKLFDIEAKAHYAHSLSIRFFLTYSQIDGIGELL